MYVRVEPAALVRLLTASLLACAAAIGCAQDGAAARQVDVAWTVSPSPSITAETNASITLRDRAHTPVAGAHLRLEAQMAHPGMAPIVVPLEEQSAGIYTGAVRFSMAGDWVLVATGDLPDGSRLTSQFAVGGVAGSR